MKKPTLPFFILLLTLLLQPVTAPSTGLTTDIDQANRLIETIPLSEVMGPLAPVALSPFFGLTCLSGLSLLSDHGIVPENNFISSSEILHSEIAFGVLALLTLFTSIPKLSKVSKPFAQLVDQMESYAGIVAYGAIMIASNFAQASPQADEVTVVYSAGIFTLSGDTLLIIVAAINLFVINTVKFLFEVLIFVSPIPAIDALFEVINKGVVAALMLIYSLSPAAAFTINIIIFLGALCLFSWARRWVKYFREIVLSPAIQLFLGKLNDEKTSLKRSKIPPKLRKHLTENNNNHAIKAFPRQKSSIWKKRSLSYLFVSPDSCILARHPLLKEPVLTSYEPAGFSARLEAGLLSNRIVFIDRESNKEMPVVFSRQYDALLEELAKVFGVASIEKPFGNLANMKSIRELLRNNDRGGLQAEMK